MDIMKKLEFRSVEEFQLEERADGRPVLHGYGAPFNKFSEDLGGWRERIEPGAFARALKENDIFIIRSHNPDLLLAGTVNGTLKLEENTRGLKFELELDDTETAIRTVKEIKSGLLRGMSIGFWLYPDGSKWERTKDDQIIRHLLPDGVDLREISTTAFPAYAQTSVQARSTREVLDEGLAMILPEMPEMHRDVFLQKIRAHDLRGKEF